MYPYNGAATGICVPATKARPNGRAFGHECGRLLELDRAAGLFEGGLGLLGVFLGDLLEDGLGAPSTRSLASLRPRFVSARTSLMTWIFLSPAAVRTTSNSSFSSSASAGAAPPAAAGRGHGHGGRGGHAELLFEVLEELGELQDGHVGDGVEDVFLGGHGAHSSVVVSSAAGSSAGASSATGAVSSVVSSAAASASARGSLLGRSIVRRGVGGVVGGVSRRPRCLGAAASAVGLGAAGASSASGASARRLGRQQSSASPARHPAGR